MSDIGEVAGAFKEGAHLFDGILERADRDAPDKEEADARGVLQNAFKTNTLDSAEFRLFIDKLCNDTGLSLTPTDDPGFGRRELLHACLLGLIQLRHERKLAARAFAKFTK